MANPITTKVNSLKLQHFSINTERFKPCSVPIYRKVPAASEPKIGAKT